MSNKENDQAIEMIAIDEINILNPRVRNQKTFKNIAENITKVGLKRPITVRALDTKTNGKKYDLVCGQGRIEAFQSHGQTQIPAIIIDASEEDALIMSLVENLARKQHRSIDLLRGIEALQQKGYATKEIAKKTGLSDSYTRCLVPECDGVFYAKLSSKGDLWDKYYMAAPKRQRQCVEQYKIVKRA